MAIEWLARMVIGDNRFAKETVVALKCDANGSSGPLRPVAMGGTAIQLLLVGQMFLPRKFFSAAIAIAAIAVPVLANSANDLNYDIKEQQNAANFNELVTSARSCMNEGARGLLIQGVRDSSTIATFVQAVCGGLLSNFMADTLQRPNKEIADFILAIAYNEIGRIPGLAIGARSSDKEPEEEVVLTIATFRGRQTIGTRKTSAVELHKAVIALASAFKEKVPAYEVLLGAAKAMTAKDRCFNLFTSKLALASVEGGLLDVSQNAETFFNRSITSIEAVNKQTLISCDMH